MIAGSNGSCFHHPDEMLLTRAIKTEKLGEMIHRELLHRFGIDHPGLEFEPTGYGNGGVLCAIACGDPVHG